MAMSGNLHRHLLLVQFHAVQFQLVQSHAVQFHAVQFHVPFTVKRSPTACGTRDTEKNRRPMNAHGFSPASVRLALLIVALTVWLFGCPLPGCTSSTS